MLIALFLARRYITSQFVPKSILFMSYFCYFSIWLASASLCIVLALLNGFETASLQVLKGLNADLHISTPETLHLESFHTLLQHDSRIQGYSWSRTEQMMIQSTQSSSTPCVVQVKGVHPHAESITTKIKSIINPKKSLHDLLSDEKVIIGCQLAEEMHVQVGDQINLYFSPNNEYTSHLSLEKKTVLISSIFKTGIEEIDASTIICSLDLLTALFEEEVIDTIQITLIPTISSDAMKQELSQKIGMKVNTWQDLYPALVSAFSLERMCMTALLWLMWLLAGCTIVSVLSMLIISKRVDCALLLTLDCRKSTLQLTFIFIGLIMTTSATILGILFGRFICHIFTYWIPIHLPEVYFINQLIPAPTVGHIALISFISIALSLITSWVASRSCISSNIIDILQGEH